MRAWLEIDLNNVVENARGLTARVAPARFCAVVKANAYGHGLVPVGTALEAAGIPGLSLAVFAPAEGFALREAGIRCPILVVGPVGDHELKAARDAGLECPVLDADDATRYEAGTAVHVKIDTGVGRFGVPAKDGASLLALCRERGLHVRGVYSHLANAEDLDDAFTRRQLAQLFSVTSRDGVAAHIAASAAAIMWPHARLDMVRCGIALYGRWPSEAVRRSADAAGCALAPALRWFAPVIQTHELAAGDSVGYGREFVARRPSTIAVLPLGYSDGLPRAAAAGGLAARLGSARAPVAGRICMNAVMVDVTDVPGGARRGDVAEFDVEDVARAAGTIDYEVLAGLPTSLERRYV